ncbi:MAG: FAD-dependent oxidoreductase [SAR202 cluster bacterium]|nr:FAD-dependent oxidoreductase [SAR202 cluster bacterium]MDP7105116.1 FAD-dependent oxidoreductase [SAR202 cluster bacterium]
MQRSAEVVILGAGVAGCATAYYLAREGVDVLVVERDAFGSHASGFALGLLNPLNATGVPGFNQAMIEAGFAMHRALWPALEEESGVDIQVRMMPHLELFLAVDDEARQQADMARWAAADGFATTRLTASEARELEPRITDDLHGAMLLENIAMLDSYRYTLALAQAAQHHGAEFVTGTAIGLSTEGGRVTGIELANDVIACESAVLAMGPWSEVASAWIGFDIPVAPLKGEIIYLEGMTPALEHHVHGDCSIVNKPDGLVWIAATQEHAGFDETTSTAARDTLMAKALRMIPGLSDLKLVRQTACLRPVTPDSMPILGRAPGIEGAYLATGAEKQGIQTSPAIGKAMADLIIRGETDMPIDSYGVERFA